LPPPGSLLRTATPATHPARSRTQAESERRRVAELELQQARYEASLAERRYAACDPDNRLIAAQLERSSETALQRVEACQARLDARDATAAMVDWPDFAGLAEDLAAAWNAPGTMMRTRQRLVRALITDIVADVDEKTREVVLVIHWKGGQHSELRVRKPKTGEHGCKTPEDALAVMRSMAARWSDEDIAASLNRMGMRTGAALVHVIDSTGLRLGRPPGSVARAGGSYTSAWTRTAAACSPRS
jgi:hypothetical protein